eukprot:m.443388 g.443388  ORF g.443388 m.443388 type:complete len:303 (+) comp21484_c0_seq5:467-1375(+)
MWTDFDATLGTSFGKQYGVCQVLRERAHTASGSATGRYSSNSIIDQNATLAEYVDAIAKAGVLACEPGQFSYGLGALVLGRVCEVAYANMMRDALPSEVFAGDGYKRFAAIMDEMIFTPLGMTSACFYVEDGDLRARKVPTLYGATLRDRKNPSEGAEVKPLEECNPVLPTLPLTVHTAHAHGHRLCDSGDTGACMTAEDYSKFYDMLINDGKSADGTEVLSPTVVATLLDGTLAGLDFDTPFGTAFNVGTTLHSLHWNHACFTLKRLILAHLLLRMCPEEVVRFQENMLSHSKYLLGFIAK